MTTHILSTIGGAHIAPRYLIVAAVIAVGVLWWVFDWNWFKHPIERRVEAATGRDFSIEGDLSVDFGSKPPA